MATVASIKQKILDKIDKLLDGIQGITSDEAIAEADNGKTKLMNAFISSYIRLGGVFDPVDDEDDDEDDVEAEEDDTQ